ncbi:death domain-containing protein [Nephila pilipes]|uniref:Death domain-containing protein n=1 Tax=Nephila pilipes TaxID=299642 RepID=A0A8X6UTK0_NEPPI|nr:death domain-containing protein [Nephila pilipes]
MAANIVYVQDLPFSCRGELCRILDLSGQWEELGGIHMAFDLETLSIIRGASLRGESPTWELLNKFSERNGTINQLFLMLARMDNQRGMHVLRSYGISIF